MIDILDDAGKSISIVVAPHAFDAKFILIKSLKPRARIVIKLASRLYSQQLVADILIRGGLEGNYQFLFKEEERCSVIGKRGRGRLLYWHSDACCWNRAPPPGHLSQ